MILFRALALFLMLITACVAAPTSPRVNNSHPKVVRRYYSVPEDRDKGVGTLTAWPVSNDGSRTINYCFESVDTYNKLGDMFELAVAKWAPAIRVSSLEFAPDPACPGKPCLCNEPNVAAEKTLHVILAGDDKLVQSTVGFMPPTLQVDHEPELPRHFLQWSNHPSFFKSDALLLMAHELGEYLDGTPWNRQGLASLLA